MMPLDGTIKQDCMQMQLSNSWLDDLVHRSDKVMHLP